ncbi:MAG TPA: NUDIX domain-containing protein [Chloroflexia bacterium]|nr:NUDIX domain-containing protein [Chloroflexia bacterium]
MITFKSERSAFNYRIVGVALHEGRVLLHKGESEDFWTLPGGRAELGEPATETLKREMREELEVEVEIERLLWVVENFFTYLDRSWHELALYFLMSLPHDSALQKQTSPFYGYEDLQAERMLLIFEWHPLDSLDNITLLPSFLKQGLKALPDQPKHVVHTDLPI